MTDFIYLVDLKDWLVCYNFSKVNLITCASAGFSGDEYPLYTADPDTFLCDCNSLQFGLISPRLRYIILSCWHRNGLRIGIGLENTIWYSQHEVDKINRIAELEVEFEKIRRQVDKSLPSRLACLFLAEDTIDSRIMLQNMFYRKTEIYIVPIKILSSKRFHKADSKWIQIV